MTAGHKPSKSASRRHLVTVHPAVGWMLVLAGLLLGGCSGANAFDRSQLPPDIRTSYDKFRFHCSRCHTLSRPLTARVNSTEHWDRYVARMRRMPGSGISARNGEIILRFLYYYTQVIRGRGQEEEVIEDALQSSPHPDSQSQGGAVDTPPIESQSDNDLGADFGGPPSTVEGADTIQGEASSHVE